MNEVFRPIANSAPTNFVGKILSVLRYWTDFQLHTVVKDISTQFEGKTGILLDVGCGDSPYRNILKTDCKYLGIDIKNQNDFGYQNKDIIYFKDNGAIPLDNNSIDCIVSTEVLEHVLDYQFLINEMLRVVKPDGKVVITVPWSARYHYIPYDYLRFTPSMLEFIFKGFKKISIIPRGTDITSICAKIMVVCLTMLSPTNKSILKKVLIPISLLIAVPLAGLAVIIGHLSLFLQLGSNTDPLGYTIILYK